MMESPASLNALKLALRLRVNGRFETHLLGEGPVDACAKVSPFLMRGYHALGSGVEDSQPFPFRPCWSSVKDDVDGLA